MKIALPGSRITFAVFLKEIFGISVCCCCKSIVQLNPTFQNFTKIVLQVQSMKSKYTGKFTTRMDDLRAANWLRATVSRNQANGQQNHAETQRKVCELEEKHGQMEKQKQPLQDERQRLATADEKYRQKLVPLHSFFSKSSKLSVPVVLKRFTLF